MGLYRLEGVAGLLLQRDELVIANHMPFSDRRTGEISSLVRGMCAGYATVGRTIKQVLFAFDSTNFLVTSRQNIHLSLLVSLDADLDAVAAAVSEFLDAHVSLLQSIGPMVLPSELAAVKEIAPAEVEKPVPVWPAVRKCLDEVLSKAMSHAQTKNFIEKTLKASGVVDTGEISFTEAKRIAIAALDAVPNRATRQSLVSELEGALSALSQDIRG